MGWCHEFGVEIDTRCSHPMTAGDSSCSCAQCGTVCLGRFEGGCEAVWRRGPRRNAPTRATSTASPARSSTASRASDDPAAGDGAPIRFDPSLAIAIEAAERTKQVRAALTNLAEQVADQVQHQARLERDLADLARVLGEHGLDVDQRLGLVEQIVDKMAAPTEQQGQQGPSSRLSQPPLGEPQP